MSAERAYGALVGDRHTFDITGVIVHFHSDDVLVKAARSIASQSVAVARTVVVCNSELKSQTRAALDEVGVEYLEMGRNVGFGAACNAAFDRYDSDLYWLVNPDVEPDRHCLERLLNRYLVTPNLGAIGPLVRLPSGEAERSTKARSYLSPTVLLLRELGIGRALRMGEPTVRASGPRFALSGACLLLCGEAIREVSGFETDYFMYGEDVDLCARLASRWGVFFERAAVCTHQSGTGAGGLSPSREVSELKGIHPRRSHWLLLRSHRSERAARRYRSGLCVVLRLRLLYSRLASRGDVVARDSAALRYLRECP